MSVSIEELIELKRDGGTHTAEELDRLVGAFVTRRDARLPDVRVADGRVPPRARRRRDRVAHRRDGALGRIGGPVGRSRASRSTSTPPAAWATRRRSCSRRWWPRAACRSPRCRAAASGTPAARSTSSSRSPASASSSSPTRSSRRCATWACAVIAQIADVDPADKKMYALRDVTATVPSMPLIVGSIISKKVAGGADAIVLDVKVGSGAFMKTEAEARALADELVARGRGARQAGRRACSPTWTSRSAAPSATRSRCARRSTTLRGDGPADLAEECLVLGAKMLVLGGRGARRATRARDPPGRGDRRRARARRRSGAGWRRRAATRAWPTTRRCCRSSPCTRELRAPGGRLRRRIRRRGRRPGGDGARRRDARAGRRRDRPRARASSCTRRRATRCDAGDALAHAVRGDRGAARRGRGAPARARSATATRRARQRAPTRRGMAGRVRRRSPWRSSSGTRTPTSTRTPRRWRPRSCSRARRAVFLGTQNAQRARVPQPARGLPRVRRPQGARPRRRSSG